MAAYESVLFAVEAEQYDGTIESLAVLRQLLTRQSDKVAILGGRDVAWLRRPGQPDAILLTGSWLTLDQDGHVTYVSSDAFQRQFRTAG